MAERSASSLARAALADVQGLMAAHEDRHDEAAAHFRQAAALWHAMEAPYLEAHALRLGAASLLRSGNPGHCAEASTDLAAAEAICAALGAILELDAIAALTTLHCLASEPAPQATEHAGVLTRREREVIAPIARGYSNRAIAEALVISERTAENHVANILGKLGCVSRASRRLRGRAWAYRVDRP